MKKLFFALMCTIITSLTASAQESNGDKEMWAKSFINQQAPEFVVEKYVTDEPNMDGKFVLIEFWATWCGPCRRAIPKLNALQKQYADDLVVVAVSDEKEEMVADWMSPKMEYASAIDTQARMKKEYEVTGIPHAVLISPKGTVVWEGFPILPEHELTAEVMGALIEKYK